MGDFKNVRLLMKNELSPAIMNIALLTDHYCYCKRESI